jgi:hypothetical protein
MAIRPHSCSTCTPSHLPLSLSKLFLKFWWKLSLAAYASYREGFLLPTSPVLPNPTCLILRQARGGAHHRARGLRQQWRWGGACDGGGTPQVLGGCRQGEAARGGGTARCAEGRRGPPGEGCRRPPRLEEGGVDRGLRGLLGLKHWARSPRPPPLRPSTPRP